MGARGTTAARMPPRLAAEPGRGFVGRTAELELLARAIAGARDARGPRVALVAGEQGAGKTALAARAARAAAERGCTVAYGRGEEGLESPFGPWRQALTVSWPEAQRERDDLFAAVLDHLADITTRDPLIVVLDDLQWADQASLLLTQAVAGSATEALGLVLCYRSTEADPASPLGALLAKLGREPHAVRIELAGLHEGDVEALVAGDSALGGEARTVAKRVWTDSGGNAFFVNALLDELKAAPHGTSASTLREVIGHRVARLGDDATTVLRAASVLGEMFSAETLAAVTGVVEMTVVDVFERAVADGLVTETPFRGFSFVHALVADTLAAGLSAPRRRALHRAAADSLAAQEADPAAVAHHLVAAQPDDRAGRERAADAAIAAGQRALDELAYEDAAARLTEAVAMIERWGLDDDRRCTALLALGRAQRPASGVDQATSTAVAAVELATRLERWEEVATAIQYFPRTAWAVADPAVVSVLERAADAAPRTTPIRALALATLAGLLHFTGNQARVRSLAEEAVSLADESGDRAARAYTRTMLLDASGGDPNPGAQLELARTVEALTRPDDHFAVQTEYELRLRRVYALMRMGELEEMDKEVHRGLALDRRRRRDLLRWWATNVQAVRAILEGRLADAEALSDTAAATKASFGQPAQTSARLAHESAIAYLRGRLGQLCGPISDFARTFPLPALRAVLVAALPSAGRDTEARQLLAELAADGFAALPRDDAWTTGVFFLADACRLLDARPEAEALYPVLQPYAGEYVVTTAASAACFGAVDRSLGQLALVCGWADRARRHLEDAVRLNARIGARPFLALARVEQAALGVPGAAEEARAIATELGIDLVFQRLEMLEAEPVPGAAELRAQGGVWTLTYAGHTMQLKDLRGLHYLQELLTRPGQELHALELQGGPGGSGSPVLDDEARKAYRRRLADIEAALEEAEAFGDAERSARASEERQILAAELARAVGLTGRSRTTGSQAERARLNVTRAIRAAIDRIADVHPELGQHLRLAVRTGAYCAYEPDPGLDVRWSTRS